VVLYTCNQEEETRESQLQASLRKVSKTLSEKQTENKRSGYMTQGVEGLPSNKKLITIDNRHNNIL
jgi:hypothetical protein